MTTITTATTTVTPQEPETNDASSPKEAVTASTGTGTNKRKRDTYTPTACNECKRRKIKCNGRTPCERCSRQLLDCQYRSTANPDESTNVDQLLQKINALQSQVSVLSDHVATQHRSPLPPAAAAPLVFSTHDEESAPVALSEDGLNNIHSNPSPSFEGPTTSAFKIKIARDSLKKESLVDDSDDGEITRPASPSPLHHRRAFESVIDPMWTITHQEATRLHGVYEEEMGMMYPIVPHEQVTTHINLLYSRPGDLFGSKLESTNNQHHDSRLDLEDIIVLKLIFACALAAEENGHSTLGMRLFHSTRDVVNDCVWGAPSIKRICSLTLASILFFQIDEERKAWRTIGIAIRMCLEMGLHQREILEQKALADIQKEQLVRLFWSLYVLDNRWSIGTGLPSHLDSDDIDPTLPRPEGFPYLTLMIEYSHLSAKVWRHISNPCCNGSNNKKNEVEYIHWQILQWAESIPEYLKLPEKQLSVSWSPASPPNRAVHRLQCLLYLRTNLMRMLVYQPALLSASAISEYTAEADMMVEIAKETIRFIFRLNEMSNIYQLQQVTFNYFLVSALAVLLLAIAHAPSRYSTQCKEEFYLALELVKKFSVKSYVSKRLWKSIKGLQRYAPKPGGHQTQHESAHDGNVPLVHGQVGTPETLQAQASSLGILPEDLDSSAQIDPSGSQMTQDFMSLFEMPETPSYAIVGSGLLGNEDWRSYPSEQSEYEALLSSTLNSCFGPSISLV